MRQIQHESKFTPQYIFHNFHGAIAIYEMISIYYAASWNPMIGLSAFIMTFLLHICFHAWDHMVPCLDSQRKKI